MRCKRLHSYEVVQYCTHRGVVRTVVEFGRVIIIFHHIPSIFCLRRQTQHTTHNTQHNTTQHNKHPNTIQHNTTNTPTHQHTNTPPTHQHINTPTHQHTTNTPKHQGQKKILLPKIPKIPKTIKLKTQRRGTFNAGCSIQPPNVGMGVMKNPLKPTPTKHQNANYPKPKTQNPKPKTQNPKPKTINLKT